MNPIKTDLLQGTLDLLILKAVSLGPLHGYGILLRISADFSRSVAGAARLALSRAAPAGTPRMDRRRVGRFGK